MSEEKSDLEKTFEKLVEQINKHKIVFEISRKFGIGTEWFIDPQSPASIKFIKEGKIENQRLQHEIITEQLNQQGDYLDTMQSALDHLPLSVVPPKEAADMDTTYPHFCFRCKREILYHHAFNNAWEKYRYEYQCEPRFYSVEEINELKEKFKKIFNTWWTSKIVEFLCCSCYKKRDRIEKDLKKRERLLHKHKRIMNKFGFDKDG